MIEAPFSVTSLRDFEGIVKGSVSAIYLKAVDMPSIGHRIPENDRNLFIDR